jgi:SNF2 family DNA or RNA helicase
MSPKLTWTGARFEISGYPAYKDQFKNAGFHFSWNQKVWWTGLVDVARKFSEHADSAAQLKLNAQAAQIAMSLATTSNFVIPAPAGLNYLPFQRVAVEYALPREYTLIADEMGCGKTIEAMGVINALGSERIKNVLIIPPAGLLLKWARELQKWLVPALSGDFATGSKVPNSNIVLANYDIIHRIKDKLMQREWDLHIYDESHYLKNPDSKRTMSVLGHEDVKNCIPLTAKKKIFLTGTPILNRPVELWPMLRVADPEGLGSNFWLFAKKYCSAEENDFGRTFDGASNLDQLQERLRAGLMIRRLKKDVLPELPPKRRQIIPIAPPPGVRATVQREVHFYDNNTQAIEAAIQQAEIAQAAGDKASYDAAAKDLRGLKQVMFEEIAKLRHDTAVAKVPFAIDHIEDVLDQVNKLVVFAHHQDVINPILERFQRVAVKCDGSMSAAQKQYAADRFQDVTSGVKLFIGSITAAGVGIDLFAASHVIFIELSWVPADVTQAEDRLHRIGQHDAVSVYHFVFDGSLDSNMAKKIVLKQNIIEQAVG